MPATPVVLHPSAVRINFNSDPDGAIVMRNDGKTLGLTPLSIEVPYSDSAVEYQFQQGRFREEDRLRRAQPAVAAVRDVAQGGDAADRGAVRGRRVRGRPARRIYDRGRSVGRP